MKAEPASWQHFQSTLKPLILLRMARPIKCVSAVINQRYVHAHFSPTAELGTAGDEYSRAVIDTLEHILGGSVIPLPSDL